MKPLDIRCNHQDRMKAADILGDALSAGQIDLDDFESRSAACVDATTRAELIANGLGVEEICTSIGADSLGYMGQQAVAQAVDGDTPYRIIGGFT